MSNELFELLPRAFKSLNRPAEDSQLCTVNMWRGVIAVLLQSKETFSLKM